MDKLLGKSFDIVATTLLGLEPLLKRELLHEGFFVDETAVRSIKIIGDLPALYRLNIKSRLALRFLVPILEFHAKHPDEFYKKIRRFDWSDFIKPEDTFAIDSVVNSPVFTNSQFMMYRCKDGIADHFVNKGMARPSVDTENPTYRINLHIQGKKVHVSLDSSGESLHKRGYREQAHPAPLNEVLAAALVDFSGYTGDRMFLDGMTGSGTLAIEAAMKATRKAPGLLRKKFGFSNWANYDEEAYTAERKAAEAEFRPASAPIVGIDQDFGFVKMAEAHAENAGVSEFTSFKTADFLKFTPPADQGLLMLNPPYGDRLEGDMDALYGEIGTQLKHSYSGWNAWIVSGNFGAMKKIGLKPMKKHALRNGPTDVTLRGYELFSGKRVDHITD